MKRSSFAAALSFGNRTQRPTQSQALSFQPTLESLGDRVLPAAGAIGGHVYQDLTGNGLSTDDTAMSHVLVELYRATNNASNLNWGDKLVGVQFSGSDGSYSFGNLSAGRYFVTEFTPWGSLQTAPTPAFDYTVNLVAGQQVGSQNFDNFQLLNTFAVRNISFTITSPNGTKTTVKDLRGHTQQGDTVEANFTIAPHSGPVTVSLVSYNAPSSSFNPSTADEQTILAVATGTFGPGQDSLSVQLPNNYYQVDFVVGPTINEFGPAGGTIFYSAQDRLLSADNGGKNALQLGTLSGTVTDTNGNVLAGATVTVTNLANGAQTVATTDSQGNYSIPGLQAGLSYSVAVSDSGYVSQTADLMLAAGSNVESFSLVPNSTSPQLANLTVTVTDGSGNALSGVTVSLLDMNQNYITTANDNGDGTYSILGVESGTYIVQAIAGDTFGSSSATVTLVAGNNSVTLTLSS